MLRPRSSLVLIALLSAQALAQSDDAPPAYRAATGLLHRDMPAEAAAEYRSFLRDNPSHQKADSARYGLAVCLTRLGKWAEAASELDAISTRQFEFAPDRLLLRAQCHLAAKEQLFAIRCLQTLLQDHSDFAQADAAAAMLGETLVREGEADKAREILSRFEREWSTSPSRPRAEFLLATIEAAQGRDQEAAERLSRLRTEYPRSEVDSRAALAEAQCRHRLGAAGDRTQAERAAALYRTIADGQDKSLVPGAMLGLAQVTRAAGNPAKAGRLLDDLLSRFAESPESDAARIERARAFLDEDKPDQSLAALAPVLSKKPGSAESAYWAAKAELRLKRFSAAAERLDHAARDFKDSPLIPEILFDRAVALARDGKAQDAASGYALVRTRFPNHPLASEALGAEASLALSGKDAERAMDLCREFLDAYPKHARTSSVQLVYAEAAALAGQDAEAAALYDSFVTANAQDPRATDAAVRRGLALARAGKADESSRVLQAALNTPGQIDAALRRTAQTVLADAAIARSDWPAAENWLRTLSQEREVTPDGILKLGIAQQRQGRAEESLQTFTRVILSSPSDPAAIQARFERAQILIEHGKLDEAKADLETVIAAEKETDPRRFTVHSLRHLASIASKQNRADDAAKLLAQVADSPDAGSAAADALYERGAALLAAGQYEEADAALAKFLATSPAHLRAADAAAQRAIATSRLGHYAQALPHMDAAEAKAVAMRPDVLSALRYERSWALKTLGRLDDARAAYERLLSSPLPANLESHASLDLAQLLIVSDQHAAAAPVLSRALKAAEKLSQSDSARLLPHCLYLRAVCELKADKPAEAAATLDGVLTRYKDTDIAPAAQLLSGQALLKSNKPEAAAERLEAALEGKLGPEAAGPALLCLGEAHAAAQDWPKSRAAFERYSKEFSKSEHWFQSQFGIAWALEHEGRHAEAISAYRDVTSRHQGATAARAQFQIGECLFAQKQYDDAVRELMKVDILYAYPEWSAAALYEAGRCLLQLNKTAEARTQFTQVTEKFKDTQWARLSAEELRKTAASAPTQLPGRSASESR